jgi:hypothetical protein
MILVYFTVLCKPLCIALVESGNVRLLESVNNSLGLLASFGIVCLSFPVIIHLAIFRCKILALIVIDVQLSAMDSQILAKRAITALFVIIVIKVKL